MFVCIAQADCEPLNREKCPCPHTDIRSCAERVVSDAANSSKEYVCILRHEECSWSGLRTDEVQTMNSKPKTGHFKSQCSGSDSQYTNPSHKSRRDRFSAG